MYSAHDPPEPGSKSATTPQPQVIVRAGKYFICTACRTLVEVPPDVVGQVVGIAAHALEEVATPSAAKQSSTVSEKPAAEAPPKRKPPKPPQRTKPACLAGQAIDGLRVPSGKQLGLAIGWVSFHLKVLDRQGSEFDRLRKPRKKRRVQPVSMSHSPAQAAGATARPPTGHAHAPVDPASDASRPEPPPSQQRGPP
ncbi:hypothetical protein AB1K70_00925 [Bremerella sp. JC770]|uniref:hypothetical protein n=1 Tax=Bremerella sp. JC770 TaxID=3232137 RepID=UPI003459BCF4